MQQTSPSGQSVAAGLVRGFLDYAEARGAGRARLLARSGIAETALTDQDARIPMAAYRALLDEAAAETGDGAIAIRFSIGTELDRLSIVGLIVHSSASVADSLVQLNRYSRLMVEVDVMNGAERFSVGGERGEIWITDNRPDPNSFPALSENAFARFIGEFRRGFPGRPFALEIEFTHPRPAHAETTTELYRVPVRYDAPRNALRMDPVWLTTEFDGTSGYVFGIFAERADALMQRLETDRTARGRLEAALLPILHQGDVTIETVAAGLGMSRQTLYRRLRAEETSFAAVLDALRFRMASDYLTARKVSVNQTAYLVGFSEPSSFVRAFRRWTGKTPTAFLAANASRATSG